jgi:two-component system chemotaxis sensor kinase CheA
VELEKTPDDKNLLNTIFRGFHTIKGGAGFLNVTPLVELCHRTENLFDKLRSAELSLTSETMDVIMAATAKVRHMFTDLQQGQMPGPADPSLLGALDTVLAGGSTAPAPSHPEATKPAAGNEPNWDALYSALTGKGQPAASPAAASPAPAAQMPTIAASKPPAPAAKAPPATIAQAAVKETTIRIDTARLDMVLNLSGEIGLTKNRLNYLRSDILQGKSDVDTMKALDEAVSQLDLLVGDLQNAVMKTRMQPIGRLFQKYPRLARDVARQLGKDVELILEGEETEIDKTMIEDLNDPLVHLVRNAVDHGVETPDERLAAGKPTKSLVKLSAEQVGDHILISIADDGKGMRADVLRRKAVEKGLMDMETANALDDRQSLNLIFLPGFSTKDKISDVSGRGVGMDVVKTNIQRLNGRIEIESQPGQGTTITISLPLTLAILPVLEVRLGDQPFAVPLALVREIIPIDPKDLQYVSGKPTLVVREEVLPVRSLADLLNWEKKQAPAFGVLMQSTENSFVLGVDGFIGRDDVVIKPLLDFKPKGIAGATLSGDGDIVLVLDMEELLSSNRPDTPGALFAKAA